MHYTVGIGVPVVSKVLEHLTEQGLLERTPRGGEPVYRLRRDAADDGETQGE